MQSTFIDGICDPAFKAVCQALAQNLADGEEIGECVSVVVNGKTVVDLWGGYTDRARTQPWQRDTLVCMFSGCYHTFTMGYLAGELVRRVTGRTVGQFLQEEICLPLQLDYHFGLSVKEQSRCAEIYEAPGGPFMDAIRNPEVLLGQCWTPLPLHDHEEDFNTELYRATEMPSFNGHGTARSVARLFCALACGGVLNGVRLLSESTIAHACHEAWDQTDVFGIPSRMSNGGFMLCNEQFTRYNSNPYAFGHAGLGGAIAFGDPDAKLGFSFCGNRMAPIADLGPYAKRLLEATELSL